MPAMLCRTTRRNRSCYIRTWTLKCLGPSSRLPIAIGEHDVAVVAGGELLVGSFTVRVILAIDAVPDPGGHDLVGGGTTGTFSSPRAPNGPPCT